MLIWKYDKDNLMIFSIILLGLILIFSYGLGNVSANPGDTIYVNASSGNDSWDGQSPIYQNGTIGPKLSINNAITSVSDNGTINIANGQYQEGNININKNITINGQSREGTIINGTNTLKMFYIYGGTLVSLNNLTLANGYSSSSDYGGAITNDGILTITNGTFTNNVAKYNGAIYNLGTLTITNTDFTNNTVQYYGGAIFNTGALIIINNTFTNNDALEAGAIDNYGTYLTITDSTFTNNTASTNGGAIYNYYSNLTITNTSFTNNSATYAGGAISNLGNSTITTCTFTLNHAAFGGAISNLGNSTVTRSNFEGNAATYFGGAIYSEAADSTFNFNFNRIVSSIANNGSAIFNDNGIINATLNWWGDNDNPNGKISGFSVINWLVLTINAIPLSIPNYNNSIAVDLRYDNGILNDPTHPELYYHDPASGHIPDGIPVTFATDLGNINSPSTIVNGIAQSTLNVVGFINGTAAVSAIIDNQSVLTSLKIDTMPLAVSSIDPLNNAIINIKNKIITIIFNKPIQPGSTYDNISITGNSGIVSIIKNINNNTLTLTSNNNYPDGNYQISIPNNSISDQNGNNISNYSSKFTLDTIAPTVTASPNGGLYNTNVFVTLLMTENGTIYYTANGNTPTTASTKYTGPITIDSSTILKFIGVDLANNPSPAYINSYTLDKIAPKVVSSYPKNKAIKVSRTKTIYIKFSENIKASTYWSKITIKKNGKKIKISKTIKGNTLYLKTSPKSSNSYYTVYVPAYAIKDTTGNNLARSYTFKFKTGK